MSHKIPLSSLNKDAKNIVKAGKHSFVVFFDGRNAKVVHDQCPHMGGPLTQGKFCAKAGVFTCPWHGYEFSAQTLSLINNPNERIWIKPLAAGNEAQFKTPEYKLRAMKHRIENDYLFIEEDL